MKRLLAKSLLYLALLAPGWAAKPMAWDSLMRVKAAAEQGNPEAQFLLGLQYKVGDGIDRDRVEAVRWLRQSAESGYAEAQFALGDFYAGLDPADELADPQAAEKWLKAAAAQGNADAQSRLAALKSKSESNSVPPGAGLSGRLQPVGSTEEPAVTIHWSEVLSGLRGAEAELVRGFMLEAGIYVNRDLAAAAEAFRQAAMRGDTRGQLWLSAMYAEGRGVTKDPVAAQGWMKQATGKGSAEALAGLAKETAGRPAHDDSPMSAKWSELLAGLRGTDAYLVRGFVLENGIHGPSDLTAAADFYRLALARGDARGQARLDQMPVAMKNPVPATAASAAPGAAAKDAVIPAVRPRPPLPVESRKP